MNGTRPPTISVVVAVYNAVATLRRCLESLAAQQGVPFEVIAIDGGSQDGSVDILQEYAPLLKYWESEPDEGIYHAWNKAVRHAEGEWLYFLGADDRLVDESVLAEVSSRLKSLPEKCRLAYGKVLVVNGSGKVVGERGDKFVRESGRAMHLPHQGTFHRRILFEEHGYFDESFRISGDYEFLLRELKTRPACSLGDLPIATMATGGLSDRPHLYLAMRKENLRAARRHGLVKSRLGADLAIGKARLRLALFKLLGPRMAQVFMNMYLNCIGKATMARQDDAFVDKKAKRKTFPERSTDDRQN